MERQLTYQQTNVISLRGLTKSFGTNKVLDGFELDLARNENLVVLGRSGSGKSVLIKCIIGLLVPDMGSIEVLGRDILSLDREELDRVRIRVGFLFQSNALYDSMTVRENLEFPMRRHSIDLTEADARERIEEVLNNVGLIHTIDMMPSELSGGMMKRIALARTMILKPDIILYDEPTAGLDPITGKEITSLIMDIRKKYNTASIIISHDMKCVKATADKIILLLDGKNYMEGDFQTFNISTDPYVQQFFE
ncbi:MAG TPA: ATP-binding cassette domain-containing protein [Sphingobacteriaceae bacterium]